MQSYCCCAVLCRGFIKGKETCTQKKCEWILPSYLKSVEYFPVSGIDFTSAKSKKRKLDNTIDNLKSPEMSTDVTKPTSSLKKLPTYDEMDLFYQSLSTCGIKPAILALIPDYSDDYVPKSSLPQFPQPLQSLFKPEYCEMDYHQLLNVCESVDTGINVVMAINLERETVSQARSKLWFKYRAGRVTALKMKVVCHTDYSNPSQSLIKSICYLEEYKFTTSATSWDCKHGKSARQYYFSNIHLKHHDLQLRQSGLVINPKWGYIGATPDGRVKCKCCGEGISKSSVLTASMEEV